MKKFFTYFISFCIIFMCGCSSQSVPYKVGEELKFVFGGSIYECQAFTDYELPKPEIVNADNVAVSGVEYVIKVYAGNTLVCSNVEKVNLESGVYKVCYLSKSSEINLPTDSIQLNVIDSSAIILESFNGGADTSLLVQPPKYNYGTQTAQWEILPEGYANSRDGVLKVVAGEGYEQFTSCRDGVGIIFHDSLSVDEIQYISIKIYQDTDNFQSRLVFGFYGGGGAYSTEFWYVCANKSWLTFKFNIEDIMAKEWLDANNKHLDSSRVKRITGIYVKNTFCLDKMYIDEVSYKSI